MDDIARGMREYIDSGNYFIDARTWYNNKYIRPLCHRSIVACLLFILLVLIVVIALNIQSLFPMSKQLRYVISLNTLQQQSAKITKANQVANNPVLSIAHILLTDYVTVRERYKYTQLSQQIKYVQNVSTRAVFKEFYYYLGMDNPESPVLRYQKEAERAIVVSDVKFLDNNNAEIHFTSKGQDITRNVFENMSWVAYISFEIDNITLGKPTGSPFHFVITGYRVQMLGKENV